jgi:hypothetical protein
MYIVTQQQRINLLEALNVMWPSVPQENVSYNLAAWRKDKGDHAGTARTLKIPPTCGTVACFGGWCAWWPAFREQGVSADSDGVPNVSSEELFGAPDLFTPHGNHPADIGFDGSDHELVSNRLRYVLRHCTGVSVVSGGFREI